MESEGLKGDRVRVEEGGLRMVFSPLDGEDVGGGERVGSLASPSPQSPPLKGGETLEGTGSLLLPLDGGGQKRG